MNIFQNRLIVLLASTLLSLAQKQPAFAGSATWSSDPVSNDWTNARNWMPNTVPNGAGDTAIFGASNLTKLDLTGLLEVAGINFDAGANSYSINAKAAANLGHGSEYYRHGH